MKIVPRSRSRPVPRPRRVLALALAGVASRFTSYSRQRGSAMAREHGVTIEKASDSRVLAHVRDGRALFLVHLTAVGRELQVECTCPVFALGRDACRHVWAAFVAADLARRLRSRAELELVRSRRARR
jgi:uncharacterized Zn finger protein